MVIADSYASRVSAKVSRMIARIRVTAGSGYARMLVCIWIWCLNGSGMSITDQVAGRRFPLQTRNAVPP